MIICLEGPDGCGKTTIWRKLKETIPGHQSMIYADFPSMGKDLWPFAEQVERRDIKLFSSLYDITKTYITDRFFAVTGPVYAQVYGRKMPDVKDWINQLHVIYLVAPPTTLVERLARRGESRSILDRFSDLLRSYDDILLNGDYKVNVIASTTPEQTLNSVIACISRLVSR